MKSSSRLLMIALLSATWLWPPATSAQSQIDPVLAQPGVPSPSQFSSAQQPSESRAAPVVVIDAFLAAQGVGDVDAAAAFFAADASITDSSGRSAFGNYAIRHLINGLNGWEAGPRLATGQEVTWAESLPIWHLSAAPTAFELALEQEVPHFAYVEILCAVVTDGKIYTLRELTVDSQRSCEPGLNAST